VHAYVTGKFVQHFNFKLTHQSSPGVVEFSLGL
jgi:hypothetical protein